MKTVNMPSLHTLDGFESIFKDNYTPLFRYVKSIVNDEDLAKDILSDLFLNLWQQKDKLQINELRPYLFRAAKNGALKAISSRYQTAQLPNDAFDIPENTYNPFEKFVAKQSIKIVEELISRLPLHRKEMIELRLLGLKNAEIAQVLDITEKKVEYNMREAIEQLGHAVRNSNLDQATIAGGLMLINLIFTTI
ncbi:sigma-70 family RNA polymerase sigma factor [Mucilaginibacter sabulilitoris]|uniref:Sigma-70 family RNA polymerase sigma factor n=1 Tax=Mucilaginibacter sabulilitoris TaxID=1173583 RepID=A0ABZ0THE4_9SPHI|nr:sigma-70 family RNA polymerase sigma factor [Mucilaginibacter sabulilitoris]WPU92016.1 sigma-70 family RNA polymerase sigma factor [Mucilaginibacter sabulilitoris]